MADVPADDSISGQLCPACADGKSSVPPRPAFREELLCSTLSWKTENQVEEKSYSGGVTIYTGEDVVTTQHVNH